jgi:hypothetical protein
MARVLLMVAFAVSTLTLTQCQMVGDKLTGVQVGTFHGANHCIKDCDKARKKAKREEEKRHRDLLRACNEVPACIEAENARYEAALAAIHDAYKACISGCHNQGGGRGRGRDDD